MALIISLIFGVLLGTGTAIFIMARVLNKSNNFGDSKGTDTEFSQEGFILTVCSNDVSAHASLDSVFNQHILAHRGEESYISDEPLPGDIESEIESMDLSGIKWHK